MTAAQLANVKAWATLRPERMAAGERTLTIYYDQRETLSCWIEAQRRTP